ncbi:MULTISPECIES: flavodoxin family protein [unclassified Breznakia]|uniref:flavodoxin family protein n=1 Tax=unclassified Breznakia TaxID=2623764 RepID=UPI0024748FDA|nr:MULTISPECIES: flavodoxin family protein [unclassified Breznakia]MDH6366563.1 multimeric flavodoxin WrbA [Breznakia sp. PH1-1]MDH6403656.1 multimeric flavodoxin WrbA [Breznakia sp. PF1-11]MDH6411365.1 multimeric flavodoxin WrbA [Breznakia sp. PFB1-11]MDH6413659.1 multimeric flavodoxin WrbA [Breznakia sp. PFB1-14]MDH6415910.1 multimeric flavodoxin WrbA [Breznakia sp. PFB1-4]
MKVLLMNGSPRPAGCTHRALLEVEKQLQSEGIETEIVHIGTTPIMGCTSCGICAEKGECFQDDLVNTFAKMAKDADGFVFGSPTYYADASGPLTAFMNRLFYSAGNVFAQKPGAAVASCRRAGAMNTLDHIQKYFLINHMPVVPSQYWNVVHGSTAEDVEKDLEGLQTMRSLAKNMAFMLKCIEAAMEKGLPFPEYERKVRTNFIR